MRTVWHREKGRCACGCGERISPFPIGYHHVFPKAKWPALSDEPDNIIGVFENCHANHETASRRFKREVVWRAERFVEDGPMASYLERTYR